MSVSIKKKTISKSKSSSKSRKHLNKSRKCGSKTRKMSGGNHETHTRIPKPKPNHTHPNHTHTKPNHTNHTHTKPIHTKQPNTDNKLPLHPNNTDPNNTILKEHNNRKMSTQNLNLEAIKLHKNQISNIMRKYSNNKFIALGENKTMVDALIRSSHALGYKNTNKLLGENYIFTNKDGITRKKTLYNFMNKTKTAPPNPKNEETYRTWKEYREKQFFYLSSSVKKFPETYAEYVKIYGNK